MPTKIEPDVWALTDDEAHTIGRQRVSGGYVQFCFLHQTATEWVLTTSPNIMTSTHIMSMPVDYTGNHEHALRLFAHMITVSNDAWEQGMYAGRRALKQELRDMLGV